MSSETTAWTDKLKRMALFAEIVDSGSLSAAARRLGSTPSAVSQQLRLLEEALGLVLLHRSTRRLTLTEAGERYYPACAAMVAQARSADQALERLRDEPEGELRLAAPIGFGELLASALEPLRRHPRLRLHLLLDDTPIDLIGERVDLALRVGRFTDSSLVARRLGELQRQLCAAPRYLAERGWPRHPGELAGHDWLGLPPRGTAVDTLSFQGLQGEREEVRVEARLLASQVATQAPLEQVVEERTFLVQAPPPQTQEAVAMQLLGRQFLGQHQSVQHFRLGEGAAFRFASLAKLAQGGEPAQGLGHASVGGIGVE